MRKEIIAIQILFIVAVSSTSAQPLSVELSIEWQTQENNLNIPSAYGNSIIEVPYLIISYINKGKRPIYFKAISNTRNKYPTVPFSSLSGVGDEVELAKKHERYSGRNYKVLLGDSRYRHASWEIIADSLSESEQYVLEFINSELSNLNFLFKVQHFLDIYNKRLEIFNLPDKQLISLNDAKELYFDSLNSSDYEEDFMSNDLNPDVIFTDLRSDFIFLKQGQECIQEFSLISFLLVGGNYEFKIRSKRLYNYVYGEPFDKVLSLAAHRKIYLPKRIKDYRLFKGKIKSTLTSVQIE